MGQLDWVLSHFPENRHSHERLASENLVYTTTTRDELNSKMAKATKAKSATKAAGVRQAEIGIEKPTEHDVLQGRGGQANNWIG